MPNDMMPTGQDMVTGSAEPSRPPVLSNSVAQTFGSVLAIVAKASLDPAVNVEKMTALLDMQERIMGKQAEINFNMAMVALNNSGVLRVKRNGEVRLLDKDGKDKGSYKFARWEDMDLVLRPLLNENHLWLSFDTSDREGGGARITATLKHADGHCQTSTMSLPLDTGPGRNNLQSMGSTLSYGKRYSTENLLNIVREDDDDDAVSSGIRYVLHEDALELERLMKEASVPRSAFMKRFGLQKNILELKADDVPIAFRELKATLAQQERQKAEGDKLSEIERKAEQEKAAAADGATKDPTGDEKPPSEQGAPLSPKEQADFDRRKASAPNWLADMINRLDGCADVHAVHAIFGHPKHADLGEVITKQRTQWMEQHMPDLFSDLRAAVTQKIQSFKTSRRNVA